MEIDIAEALNRSDLIFIDVRSPGEYAAASIPGAVNIPIFDNIEHRQLGEIFHSLGENEARRTALAMVSPKLPTLIDHIANACGNKVPLLYCQRGGLRSLSLYHVLNLIGMPVLRLKKGYKAFRRYVNERLSSYQLKNRLYILHGLTGVGKTAVLKELEKQGFPIIDLEGLACHRGSVFGAIGLNRYRSQKDFDALLLQQLDRHSNASCLVMEGEGNRIGNIYLPAFLSAAISNGHRLLLTASIETRVKRIMDTYITLPVAEKTINELKKALCSLQQRMGAQKTDRLTELLEQGKYAAVVEILCVDYYDRYYSDSRPECSRFDAVIDATDLENAVRLIIELIDQSVITSGPPAMNICSHQ